MSRKARAPVALLMTVALAATGSACRRSDESSDGGDVKRIKVGASYPLSGQLSGFAATMRGARAYFDMVNDDGGVDGREIEFLPLDDGYDPARTLRNARRLVEQERVFTLFGTLGTPTNLAAADYVKSRKAPNLFIYTGAPAFGDPEAHPTTILGLPDYALEGSVYGEYLKQKKPEAKVAVLYQNDDYGKSFLNSFAESLNSGGVDIVAQESYEATDPSVDPKVTKLARSGADVFVNFASPKFAAQAIKHVAEVGWSPLQIVNSVSASKTSVLEPAGLDNARGLLSIQYFKDPETPQWAEDADMKEFRAAMQQYGEESDANDPLSVQGWLQAEMLVAALKGMKEVSPEGLLESARNLDTHLPMLLPDIDVKTGPDDPYPVESLQIQRFDGDVWQLEGEIIRDER